MIPMVRDSYGDGVELRNCMALALELLGWICEGSSAGRLRQSWVCAPRRKRPTLRGWTPALERTTRVRERDAIPTWAWIYRKETTTLPWSFNLGARPGSF